MSGKGAKAFGRQVVDDGSPGPNQQRQESLSHAVGAEQVDGEVPFEHGPIAQVVVERHAGVIDEDVERVDFIDRSLDLCSVGHVQGLRGATRPSPWVKGWRAPAYTRFAPLFNASSTRACPMPRLAPVTRTVLSAMVISSSCCWAVPANGRRGATSALIQIRCAAGIHRSARPEGSQSVLM